MRVAAALEGAGYQVVRVADALEGLNMLHQTYPDMIIIDSELATINGEDACLRIRQASFSPMMVLGSPERAVEVLELGADAFMTKPPSLIELVARVGRLLQRNTRLNRRENKPQWYVENDLQRYMENDLQIGGNGLSSLSAIEFSLALRLVLSKGKIVDYSQLINEAWRGKEVSIETLHFYMHSLREKLQSFFRGRIKIINHQGVGYHLEEIFE